MSLMVEVMSMITRTSREVCKGPLACRELVKAKEIRVEMNVARSYALGDV